VNGVSVSFDGRQDTVQLPYFENNSPGQVKILIPFTEPSIVGKFVFHCHIMEHEDNGMMAIIQVLPSVTTGVPCLIGSENCQCSPKEQCFNGLNCVSNVCVSETGNGNLVPLYVIISVVVGVIGLILIIVSVVFFIKNRRQKIRYELIQS